MLAPAKRRGSHCSPRMAKAAIVHGGCMVTAWWRLTEISIRCPATIDRSPRGRTSPAVAASAARTQPASQPATAGDGRPTRAPHGDVVRRGDGRGTRVHERLQGGEGHDAQAREPRAQAVTPTAMRRSRRATRRRRAAGPTCAQRDGVRKTSLSR